MSGGLTAGLATVAFAPGLVGASPAATLMEKALLTTGIVLSAAVAPLLRNGPMRDARTQTIITGKDIAALPKATLQRWTKAGIINDPYPKSPLVP